MKHELVVSAYNLYKGMPLAEHGIDAPISELYDKGFVHLTGRSIMHPHPHRHYTFDEFFENSVSNEEFGKFFDSLYEQAKHNVMEAKKIERRRDKLEDEYIKESEKFAFLSVNEIDMGYVIWLEKIAERHFQDGDNPWIKYQWDDLESRPSKPGRFEVYRPSCDKQHYCQWNGSGWSSENNTIKYYRKIIGPSI